MKTASLNLTFVLAGNTPGAPSPAVYHDAARRFRDSYTQYPSGAAHRLVLIDSNGGFTQEMRALFSSVQHEVLTYRGSGWDIGAHQFAAMNMDADDWVMCFSSWAHFRQPGWLKAFVDAREKHGDALYGSMASYENNPHIRGTGFFVRCERIHRYPHGCNSRDESFKFESGPDSLTQWCLRQCYGAYLVTPEGTVSVEDARQLRNTFRAGDQSNIWTFDKHTAIYDAADPEERARLNERTYALPLPRWRKRLSRLLPKKK